MSRTERKNYLGKIIRDGFWGKKCSSEHCNVCGSGKSKRPKRRVIRRAGRNECQEET